MDLNDGALKSAQTFTELEMVKVGGSNIIGLQKWVGPVPPTYNGSDAHVCIYIYIYSVYICMYVCMYVCVCVCVYIYIYIHLHLF